MRPSYVLAQSESYGFFGCVLRWVFIFSSGTIVTIVGFSVYHWFWFCLRYRHYFTHSITTCVVVVVVDVTSNGCCRAEVVETMAHERVPRVGPLVVLVGLRDVVELAAVRRVTLHGGQRRILEWGKCSIEMSCEVVCGAT